MRFGCCTSWFDRDSSDKFAVLDQRLEALDAAGYDFAEFPVSMLARDVTDFEFANLLDVVAAHDVTVDAFNAFIPPFYPLVGPERKLAEALQHVDFVADRMAALGGKIVVFGSGGARRVPEGFSRDTAYKQLLEFISEAAELLAKRGITMVLEPLNQKETNIINSLAEAVAVLAKITNPNVKLLVDLYHMLEENEPLAALEETAGYLQHVHVADTERARPGAGRADFTSFRQYLERINYNGRICVECQFSDFFAEAKPTLQFLRATWA